MVPHSLPMTAQDWLRRAASLLDQGVPEDACAALQQAIVHAPEDAAFHVDLTTACRSAGMEAEAAAAEMAAIALEQRSSLMLYNLATFYLMTKRPALAEKWYRATLRIDPELVMAHQNLASILELQGRKALAQYHRNQAYGRQCLFVDDAEAPKRSVLILCAAATGNVPFDFLLPQHSTKRIKLVLEYASDEQIDMLPPHDLVFNAIGDQDVTARSEDAMKRFLRRSERPLFNHPDAIARTARELIPALLQDIEHVVVPPTARLHRPGKGELARALIGNGMRPPLLLRPAGSHGGHGLQLIESAIALIEPAVDQDYYASPYHEYRSEDGYYRKYRVIFVDRQPFPYHLAISPHWQVHYATADMLPHRWKRDEEQRFLQEPAAVLGETAMHALRMIGQKLDLDFCGIDFSLLPDGRILVFEANATMLVHLEQFHACLAFKNSYVQRILDAFDAMLNSNNHRRETSGEAHVG
jgi:tetratricopeptide (TPR) repeat protein